MHGKRLQEPHTQGVDIRLLLMKFHVEALPGMGVTALDLACLDSLEFGKLCGAVSCAVCGAVLLRGFAWRRQREEVVITCLFPC